jgi:hypothetical protein
MREFTSVTAPRQLLCTKGHPERNDRQHNPHKVARVIAIADAVPNGGTETKLGTQTLKYTMDIIVLQDIYSEVLASPNHRDSSTHDPTTEEEQGTTFSLSPAARISICKDRLYQAQADANHSSHGSMLKLDADRPSRT